jgi:hypothetical protein
MKLAVLKNKTRYGSFFIPFRLQFVMLVVVLLLAYRWLQKNHSLPDSSYTAIITVFISVTLWFIVALFILSFLSAFIPWLFFLLSKKNNRASIRIKTAVKENVFNEDQNVHITIHPILKPLFGYIRLRLKYDDGISPKFSPLNDRQKIDFFSTSLSGSYNWPLPQIKEYKVTDSIIYFEDMFQLFSFAATLPAQDNFFTQPANKVSEEVRVQPKKTEDTNTRIDQIRKVEGEFLNYKNFENNDDVRRIVWKIYAKNKELVVRIPETNDPYASHVYFYSSFYNSISTNVYEEFNIEFLNHYKTIVWNAFQQLSKQNVLLKYIPDQEPGKSFADDPVQRTKYVISTSGWQIKNDLQHYFKKEEASVLCISSLTDAKQVENILDRSGKDLVIIFVQLSQAFSKFKIDDWLKWIFVRPKKDSLEKLRFIWNLSPLKSKMTGNEAEIRNILAKSDSEIVIL